MASIGSLGRPGRYFLSASYRPGQRLDPSEEDEDSADSGKSGYVPTYYPGTADPARATAITIKPGGEIPSMDLMFEPTAVYSIRGHVNNFVARRNANSVILVLEVRSCGPGWSIRGIAPGDYTLFSWEEVEGNAWEDPDFLKPFESEGQSISLQDGDGKSMDLPSQFALQFASRKSSQ